MHMINIFNYGHQTVEDALYGVTASQAEIPGACGAWSIKDIVAHLASFELVLGDLLLALQGKEKDTERLHQFIYEEAFNDRIVVNYRPFAYSAIKKEYERAHKRAAEIIAEFPKELYRESGLIAWYGDQYDLEDFIAYTFFGHKIEHSAQIVAFMDSLKNQQPVPELMEQF